ncbi:unnamed protein product [Effrenium voratum]|uniref:Uncharacterized protein n=1 Tax=Effrenium voratum TaxID=2562239 RepID=A0AA36JK22_9DINO|nr:unnamed protein product [Effrenium voratum]
MPLESVRELQVRAHVAPLWLSIDCGSFAKCLDFLQRLGEAFSEKEAVDRPHGAREGADEELFDRLQHWDLSVSCTKLSAFLPSAAGQDPQGIVWSCGLHWSLRQLRSQLRVSSLCACHSSRGGNKEGAILHPCRVRLDVELSLERRISGQLRLAPLCVSLKTEHVPLLLRTWRYLLALDAELAAFGHDPRSMEKSGSFSSLKDKARSESSERRFSERSWRAVSQDLEQVGEIVLELVPTWFVSSLWHAASVWHSCRLQLDLELEALHIGLVQSSTDAELAVVLIEDLLLSLDQSSFAQGGQPSPMSVYSPGSASPSPRSARRRRQLAGRAAISANITSTELARATTLLEPVVLVFNLFTGKHQPSSCKVSWVNLNLSSALIETLVSLYHDALARIEGMQSEEAESPCSAASWDSESPKRTPCQILSSKGLQRQVSISSRQPQLSVRNLLGQDVSLEVLESGCSGAQAVLNDTQCVVKLPWCTRALGAARGWGVLLHLFEMEAKVFLQLTATSALKSVAVKPDTGGTRSSLSSSLFSSSCRRCNSIQSTQSNLDVSKSALASEAWILVRTEVGSKLHELEVTLSSVLFVENRTEVSVSIGPYGSAIEGFLELPPKSEPRPVPLAWLAMEGKQLPQSLWVAVTGELKVPPTTSSGSSFSSVLSGNTDSDKRGWMRSQRKAGILQPLIGKNSWQAMCRYRSMVANDYFLRSRKLHLHDRHGEESVCLCSTVCGVSADLQASLQALLFSVTLEPAALICNRLPCPLQLTTSEGPVLISCGEDVDMLKPSQLLKLNMEVPPCTGVWEEPLLLQLETPVWPDRLPREKHQKRLLFHEATKNGAEAEDCAKLMVTLETEPGLTTSEYWSPLQVRQFSPRSVRLVFFTQYWLLNRRSDCRVCLPQEILTRDPGEAKFGGRLGADRRHALMQFDCNTLRMVSENLVRSGKIRVGLCDQRYNANGESAVPVTQPFRINQPTVGAGWAPRSQRNPVQRCFGFTVRPAPLPFYRTLIVEVVRRYTLLNHKEHMLFCLEPGAHLPPLQLLCGASAAFDPQGDLHLAISGVPVDERPPPARSATSRRSESPEPCRRRAVTWADETGEGGGRGQQFEEHSRTQRAIEQELYSAPFVLAESGRSRFQLMHQMDLGQAVGLQKAELARPEPLLGPVEAPTAHGRAWCLTAVDIMKEQGSVVVRFSEPLRPQFRIINRTGHAVGLRQDCEGAPALELAPEHRMSFCWFQPEGPQKLKLRLGSKEHSYEVGMVEEHSPPLLVERPPSGQTAGWFREEFLVQTKVSRGSREVHIHPHCRLSNLKGHALLVRSGTKSTEIVVPHQGSVCLQRDSKSWEQVMLQIASCTPGTSAAWSAPIMVTKNLAGHRGFLRHMQSGGAGQTSVFEITMVDVKKDPVSDFLVVELRPYVKTSCPYFFENVSHMVCSVRQLEGPETALELFPGESAPFVPVGAVICGQGTFQVRLGVGNDEEAYSTIIDIELPQETVIGALHVRVLKERPRHIILNDVLTDRRAQKQAFPPFRLMRRWLGSKKPPSSYQEPPRASPRRRGLTGLSSPSPRSPRKRLDREATPRIMALPSTRSLGSISRLRRGSLDIFWTIHGRRKHTKGLVFHLDAQGLGITLADSAALHEVAYLCADSLVASLVRDDAAREMEMCLGSLQLDVRDGAQWRSNVMLRPKRGLGRARPLPFLSCSAKWQALDRGAGPAAHFEVESLKIDVQPIELRLDTLSSFQLALFGLDLLRRAEPLVPFLSSLRSLKQHWRTDGEQLMAAVAGDSQDPVLGEPPCPEYDDFDAPTPVFIKHLLVRRIQFFVSVRFSGKGASDFQGNEALQAVDIVLRKLIPFDVSQARISLGPFFRRRPGPGAPAPKPCRLFSWILPCLGQADGDACLEDEFLPHGFSELLSEAAALGGSAVLRQIPQLLGAQRLLGSPAHLCAELGQAMRLALLGVWSCSPWLLLAALLTVIAALLESVEGIFMIVAKTTCRITAGTVPAGLRKEASGFPGALMDLLWYGFPWHFQQIYRECRRQSHIAYSSHSLKVSLSCLLEGTWYILFSILSSAMVIVAKLFQSLQLLCHTLAWYVCPERVAELGAPLSRRVGPLLFHLGSALQFSHTVTNTMGVVHKAVRGTRLRDWRLRQLGREGSLLAVQGSGFYLVRSSALLACVPAREADVFLAWQARGNWQRVELRLLQPSLGKEGNRRRRFLLCFYRNTSCKVLRLRSRRAALSAFSFAQECISSWARAGLHAPMAPESPRLRLLRKVHRSAAVRASG